MSLQNEDDKWNVLYYSEEDHIPRFQRFDSKDEVMHFIAEWCPYISLNDVTVFPPHSDLEKQEIASYGLPEMFRTKGY